MRMLYLIPAFAVGLGLLWGCQAMAAGPYIVDDAGIVDPNTFQSESWVSRTSKSETLAVVNGAYRVMGSEVTVQEAHDDQSGNGSDMLSSQIKYRWREGDNTGCVASSLVVGGSYSGYTSSVSGLYAYVPATVNLTESLDLNVNVGWQYTKTGNQNVATWGIGTEYHFDPALSFVSEIFGHDSECPGFQLGSRAILTDNFQLNAVYGHNVFGASENVMTVGFTASF